MVSRVMMWPCFGGTITWSDSLQTFCDLRFCQSFWIAHHYRAWSTENKRKKTFAKFSTIFRRYVNGATLFLSLKLLSALLPPPPPTPPHRLPYFRMRQRNRRWSLGRKWLFLKKSKFCVTSNPSWKRSQSFSEKRKEAHERTNSFCCLLWFVLCFQRARSSLPIIRAYKYLCNEAKNQLRPV